VDLGSKYTNKTNYQLLGRALKKMKTAPSRRQAGLFTPPQGVTSLFSRAGGFPKVPAAAPPECIPFADAFQHLLTARAAPPVCISARAVSRRSPQRHHPCVFRSQHTGSPACGLCVVGLPAISAFQRHSTQHLLRCRSPSSQSHLAPARSPFQLCSTHWV
jgi:hypothetical protein